MNESDERPGTAGAPSLGWLAAGAAAGLLIAAVGLLRQTPGNPALPADVIATVNDATISTADLDSSIEQLEARFGRPVGREDRARALQQMIDEELLVQRGVDLGLPTGESTVRAAIVQSLVASVTAEADAADPDDATLQAFLDANADRYTFASAMHLDAWTTDSERDARYFLNRLESGAEPADDDGLVAVPGLPDAPAPLERLRMFVGPAIAASAADMSVGSSAVFPRQGRWYVVRVNSREETALADLDSVRSQVLLDYRRALAEERLADYVEDLRRRADITVVLPE